MKIVNGFGKSMLKNSYYSLTKPNLQPNQNSLFFENFSTSSCNRKNWNNDYNIVSNSH